MKPETQEWVEIADEDLRAANGLLGLGLSAQVAFHCQQAVEKLLKALMTEADLPAPRIHDLVELAGLMRLDLTEAQRLLLTRLSYQVVASRYPGPARRYTVEEVQEVLIQTGKLVAWLRAKLT